MSNGYNGWTNYETWVANLHISNGEGMAGMVRKWAEECVQDVVDEDLLGTKLIRAEAARYLETRIEELICEDMPEVPGIYADLLSASLGAIDFREIAEHYVAEVELWSAGWNMPGYMPDDVPALFLDAKEAREYIAEYLEKRTEDPEFVDPARFEDAVQEIRSGRGELGVTIGNYHYFVMKV